MLFTCIKSQFFRNHFPPNWSFCWNVIDSLFKWSCSIDCQAHIFFFKTKNCSNDDIFISCDDRIGKMLHNICMSAVAMSLRWANRGPWASCLFSFSFLFFLFFFFFFLLFFFFFFFVNNLSLEKEFICKVVRLNAKQRRSRWDGSLWVVSSGSMLFAKALYHRLWQWKS